MTAGEARSVCLAMPVFDIAEYANYVAAFRAAGAELKPSCEPESCDGLLLPGGGDIDPARYGRKRLSECGPVDQALDDLQWNALERFVRAGKPVLGICRGQQLVNAFFGGTLTQHIPQFARHSRMDAPEDKRHPTRAAKGSFIEALYGETLVTNSSHHQAADALGRGLEAAQWSDDGVVEAIWHLTLPVWCVQWHPERMCLGFAREGVADGMVILKWFVDICAGWA